MTAHKPTPIFHKACGLAQLDPKTACAQEALANRLECVPLAVVKVVDCANLELCCRLFIGSLAEWSIAPVLKTGKPKGFQGSNP
ncbi:MAG: hypothetical protein RL710_193 [Pseudomonadota bacterium]|jgi:hypothetical protein